MALFPSNRGSFWGSTELLQEEITTNVAAVVNRNKRFNIECIAFVWFQISQFYGSFILYTVDFFYKMT
jgi:hypothetical protein